MQPYACLKTETLNQICFGYDPLEEKPVMPIPNLHLRSKLLKPAYIIYPKQKQLSDFSLQKCLASRCRKFIPVYVDNHFKKCKAKGINLDVGISYNVTFLNFRKNLTLNVKFRVLSKDQSIKRDQYQHIFLAFKKKNKILAAPSY